MALGPKDTGRDKLRDLPGPKKGGQIPSNVTKKSKKIIVMRVLSRSENQDDKLYKFDKDRIVLGSVVSADLRLTGDGVSPIHAVLEVSYDAEGKVKAVIFDLASDTGVFVNDKKVVSQKLVNEDKITIGRHRVTFSLEELNRTSGKDRIRETEGRALFLNPKEDLAPLNLVDERQVIEIFDYRPASKRALEIVMSWCDVILNVQHFVNEKSITVGGSRKSDFGIPTGSSGQMKIVTQEGGGFVLNLDNSMKGVMQSSGDLRNLDEIREQANSGSAQIPIGNNDFAKISIGEVDFYFSFTAAPPRLKRRRLFERDPFFLKIFSFSMIFTVLFMITLSRVKLPKSIDADQVPDRIATILYQPEKFMRPPPVPVPKPKPTEKPKPEPKVEVPPPPKPVPKQTVKVTIKPKPPEPKKPIPKVMNVAPEPKKPVPPKPPSATAQPSNKNKPAPKAAAKEGEGARAKGAEGSRGEKNLKKTKVKVTSADRPSPKNGDKGATGDSQIEDEGNVDILKGAGGRIQNILGNSAGHLGEGSKKLRGFGNFSTGGSGGLALSGGGTGGGGDAETTLGGLGKKGSGMGRVGTGKGAAGNGHGMIGSDARVSIRSDGPEEAVVSGSIDRDAVAAAIAAHRDEFRLCYEREINAEHPTLSGEVATSFVIGASGHVSQAGVESSSLHSPPAERCILKVLKRIDFPMPNGGGVVEVHYPFKFSSTGH
jgi:outer membrane biosynthesis protein TonB